MKYGVIYTLASYINISTVEYLLSALVLDVLIVATGDIINMDSYFVYDIKHRAYQVFPSS